MSQHTLQGSQARWMQQHWSVVAGLTRVWWCRGGIQQGYRLLKMKQYLMSLQDVEKLASKKGVVLQTIKEVLQSLVDDGMVHQDKIGSSNYFW